jgi:hypothetical protein
MTGSRAAAFAILVAAAVAMPSEAMAQCPMCRQALMSPDAAGLAAAFRSGILFLLAAPFVVFGAVATIALRTQRRGRSSELRIGD